MTKNAEQTGYFVWGIVNGKVYSYKIDTVLYEAKTSKTADGYTWTYPMILRATRLTAEEFRMPLRELESKYPCPEQEKEAK